MHAAVYFKRGKPEDVLQAVNVEDSKHPEHNEVLIRVLLRPVHHGDLLGISGRYQPGSVFPKEGVRVGFEGYGIVEEASDGVDLKQGTRVAFFPGRGTWIEKATVSAEYVTEIPDNVSEEAAAEIDGCIFNAFAQDLTDPNTFHLVEAGETRPPRKRTRTLQSSSRR